MITFLLAPLLILVLVLYRHQLYSSWTKWIQNIEIIIGMRSYKATFEMVAQRASPVVATIGRQVFVHVHSPEHVQTVLNSPHCLEKAAQYRFLRVNRGLFAAPVHLWKPERKALMPSFGPAMLAGFVDVFNEKSGLFVELMGEYLGVERDFEVDISRCFFDIIYKTAYGVDFDLQRTPEGKKYVECQDECLGLLSKRIHKPWIHLEFFYRFTSAYRRETACFDTAREIQDRIFRAIGEESGESNAEGPKIFIQKLFELNEKLVEPDSKFLRDHLLTINIAGSDASLITFGNVLMMLAIHQDIQDRVYQELMEVIGTNSNESISQEDAKKLIYMEMVCKETMRLYAIGGQTGRTATQDIVLDDNYTIPANATVFPVFYQLHRDPTIWGPNAAEFDPERFQPEVAAQRHTYAYLPFSGGPRMCLGVRYAWLAMKVMLGHVLRRYRLRSSLTMDTIELDYSFMMRVKQGCQVSFEER